MLAKPNLLYNRLTTFTHFYYKSRFIGSNDPIKLERKLYKKKKERYGIQKRLYNKEGFLRTLPMNLYRARVTQEEIEHCNDQVKRAMSLNNASKIEIQAARRKFAIEKFGDHELDTGGAGSQAAAFCEMVIDILVHLKDNPKDIAALIRLHKLLVRRKKALCYLKRNNFPTYGEVLRYYGIKDLEEGMHKDHWTHHKRKRWL